MDYQFGPEDWEVFEADSMKEFKEKVHKWQYNTKGSYGKRIKIMSVQTHCINNRIEGLVIYQFTYDF